MDKNTIIPDEIKVHSLSNEDWIALLFNKLPEGCVPVATGSVYHPAQAPAGMVGKIMLGNLVSMEAK